MCNHITILFVGLKNVYLSGLCAEDDDGESIVRIPAVQQLHKLIGRDLISSGERVNGDEIRFLRSEMGLTAEDLSELMDESADVVQQWEEGLRTMSAVEEALFRLLTVKKFGLPQEDPRQAVQSSYEDSTSAKSRIEIEAMCTEDRSGKPFVEYRAA